MRAAALLLVTVIAILSVGILPVAADPKAVVELFTSQGCSSCPAADRLAAEMARNPDLVVLSLPVDYWDYLGWKDTLASHRFTLRQQAYSRARGDREVYTPQVVVNGISHRVGSDRAGITAAIEGSGGTTGALGVPVAVAPTAAGYRITIGPGSGTGGIWLVPVERLAKIAVGRGENGGATLSYANVARDMRRIGSYAGTVLTLDIGRRDVAGDGADAFAVLVQESDQGRPGAMLGAAMAGATR